MARIAAYFMEFRGTNGKWYRARWTVGASVTEEYLSDRIQAWRQYMDMKKPFEPFQTRLVYFDRVANRLVVIG